MSLVTASEHASAVADVALLLEASGLVGELHRRSEAAKSRYGEEESEYQDTEVRFAFEWRPKPRETIGENAHDAEIHVLPGLDLREEDRVGLGGATYKVLSVVPENLFGAMII